MREHYNGLTPAEAERLAMLAEEAGEIVQAVGKVLRHGYRSTHPDGGPSNRENLEREVTDLVNVVNMMCLSGDLSWPLEPTSEGLNRKLRYAHHQGDQDEE